MTEQPGEVINNSRSGRGMEDVRMVPENSPKCFSSASTSRSLVGMPDGRLRERESSYIIVVERKSETEWGIRILYAHIR
jgi:hypothetical protein